MKKISTDSIKYICFIALFAQKQYQSLEDVLNEQSVNRKRGKKNE